MGFQDRDYTRHETQYGGGGGYQGSYGNDGGGSYLGRSSGRMMVTNIVIVCAVIFLADAFTQRKVTHTGVDQDGQMVEVTRMEGRVSEFMSLKANLFTHPWQAWQLLSYGFAHASLGSRTGVWHILFNMFTLWMLGRAVEMKYGPREFLVFYLVSIVVAGFIWVITRNVFGETNSACVGASGAVSAVVMLFILNFPREKLLIWGVFPVPAWILGVVIIGYDMLQAFTASDGVAHDAHLAGVAFAAVYWKFGWRLSDYVPRGNPLKSLASRGPKLRVHDPDTDKTADDADRVLDKLHREGQESLTRKEKKILEEYSRKVREKRG